MFLNFFFTLIVQGVNLPVEMKKTQKPELKDSGTAATTANAALKSDGILKSQKENMQR